MHIWKESSLEMKGIPDGAKLPSFRESSGRRGGASGRRAESGIAEPARQGGWGVGWGWEPNSGELGDPPTFLPPPPSRRPLRRPCRHPASRGSRVGLYLLTCKDTSKVNPRLKSSSHRARDSRARDEGQDAASVSAFLTGRAGAEEQSWTQREPGRCSVAEEL